MSSDDLFTADFFVGLAISLALTLAVYCAFPLIYARVRSQPLTKKAYRWTCFIVNFVVMIVVKIIIGSTSWSYGPYLLWTTVFSNSGCKKLKERGILPDNSLSSNTTFSSDLAIETSQKKFICKKCGAYSTGWYQICPSCGAKGQMVKTETSISSISLSEGEKEIKNQQENGPFIQQQEQRTLLINNKAVRYCRLCGKQLIPGASFCANCGTKLDYSSSTAGQEMGGNVQSEKLSAQIESSSSTKDSPPIEPQGRHEAFSVNQTKRIRSAESTIPNEPGDYTIDSILKEFM